MSIKKYLNSQKFIKIYTFTFLTYAGLEERAALALANEGESRNSGKPVIYIV